MDNIEKTGRNKIKSSSFFLRKEKLIKVGSIVGIIVGLIILSYPLFPYLQYRLFSPPEYSSHLSKEIPKEEGLISYLPTKEEPTTGNRLIIPKIGINTKIVEGQDNKALLRGAWRIPQTSNPASGGNTVITGHRFRFLPPNNTTFYLLDQLGISDEIIVIWEAKEYHYRVKEIKVVNPNQTEILANNEKPILTLYTCTPLFSIKQRLVVISELT